MGAMRRAVPALLLAAALAAPAPAEAGLVGAVKRVYQRKVGAPRQARRELEEFINERPDLKAFAVRERHDESVGPSRLVQRIYLSLSAANFAVLGGGLLLHLTNPELGSMVLVQSGHHLLPQLAFLGAIGLPLRGWRQQIKTQKAVLDSNGEILAEAIRLGYELPEPQLTAWYDAGLFRTKDYRKVLKKSDKKKDKEKEKAEE